MQCEVVEAAGESYGASRRSGSWLCMDTEYYFVWSLGGRGLLYVFVSVLPYF